ncbi:MAG TPA: alpha-galactosidase [Candidatus Latescibacteria bacterium]|nr:alpha-galactosidase [Candidatus Latescibacterota bacterium]
MEQKDKDAHKRVEEWTARAFDAAANTPPFSFVYGGERVLLSENRWEPELLTATTAGHAREFSCVFRDRRTGLVCTCEFNQFLDFPAVEWLLHFENAGTNATPIISDILPLDTLFAGAGASTIRHANGSLCRNDDFAPHETALKPGETFRIGTTGGRSSNGALPFFSLHTDKERVIGGIGWTGNWRCTFAANETGGVRVSAGMQKTHLSLLPGEKIRSPRILLLFWNGEPIDGQNALRRFLLAHHTPLAAGNPPEVPLSFVGWGENRSERQIAKARWFALQEIPLDNYWIDAGWHGDAEFCDKATVFNTNWGAHVGNWWPNRSNYPEGMAPIGKVTRELGMKFTLWFEPERVFKGTFLTRHHPEWLSGPIGDNWLFDLGNREARAGLVDIISSVITEGGITVYRQDFNMDPEPFWNSMDTPERVGMAEIRHIEGLYAFWDELMDRHPGLLIDNCSSGGRRIDLETISRSIPLWRSDYQCYPDFDPIGMQGQTHGLSLWVPLSAGCCDRPDTYAFRSTLIPGATLTTTVARPDEPEGYRTPWDAFPVEWLQTMAKQYQELKPYALGDFYPLISFSLADDVWAVWQFHRADLESGVILAFRRQNSPYPEVRVPLKGVLPNARYRIQSYDGPGARIWRSGDLTAEGFSIIIGERPGSRLFRYELAEKA